MDYIMDRSKHMAKILILANSSTGLYAFRNELVVKLLEDGNEVVVSLPDDTHVPELTKEGCRVIHTEIDRRGMNPLKDYSLIREYRKLLRAERPDMVLTYTIKPNVYGGYVCGKLHIPFITTITGLGTAFEKDGMVRKVVVFLYKNAMKHCSCLFFQNAANQEIFAKLGIKGAKSRLVGGSGVNLQYHACQEYPGHEGNVTKFLYVGRLMKEKGIEEYLAAAKQMHDRYGDRVLFETIGYDDDSYAQRMEEAQKGGFVKAHPFQKDVRPYYNAADVLVQPSYHEGMSNVIMEAAAAGRPILCSAINGCKELVEDGTTGFLFEPKDADSLAQAMDKFLQLSAKERKNMGLAARAKMEREFNRHTIMEAYADEIYARIK